MYLFQDKTSISLTAFFDFIHFGISQSPIPPSLQEVPQESFLAIQKTKSEDVTIDKKSKSPPEDRQLQILQFSLPYFR